MKHKANVITKSTALNALPKMAVQSEPLPNTRFLSVDELCEQTNIPVADLTIIAVKNELPSLKLVSGKFLFHPDSPKILMNKVLEQFNQNNNAGLQAIASPDHEEIKIPDSKPEPNSSPTIPAEELSSSGTKDILKKRSTELKEEGRLSVDEEPKTERVNIVESNLYRPSKNIERYCELNQYDKHKLTNESLSNLLNRDDTQYLSNFVELLNLKIKPRSENGTYFLDVRKNDPISTEIKATLCCKSGRYNLQTNNYNEAVNKANLTINEIREKLSFLDFESNKQEKTLNNALEMSVKANYCEAMKTEAEMNQKIGFWSFICGSMDISLMTHNFILSITVKLKESGFENSTINSHLVELRKALKLAKKNDWIQSVPDIHTFKSNRRYLIELPWTETWLPLVQSYSNNWEESSFLKFIWHFGQRSTNVFELKFENISIENKLAHIASSAHKSNDMIDVPLSDECINIIEEIKQYHQLHGIKSSKLFPTLESIDRKRWKKALADNDIDPNLVLHHVRHYFITDIIRNGASLDDAQKAGGYKSRDGVSNYMHVGVTEETQKAVNQRTGI